MEIMHIKALILKKHKYLGDPINIIRIFNDKYVDEMSLFDYSQNKTINYELLKKISNEAFFPISYGGGIESLKMIEKVISCGYERVIINSHQYKETGFLENSIKEFGTSTIIAAIDIKNFFGRYKIYTNGGRDLVKFDLANYLIRLNNIGVSEIIINSITNDGTKSGYDYKLIDIVNEYLTNTNFIIAGGSRGKKILIYVGMIKLFLHVLLEVVLFFRENMTRF